MLKYVRPVQKKKIEKEKDLKTSPSALPAGQRKKKFGSSEEIDFWVNSCEDSNLRLCNIGIKCSTS